MSYTKYDDFMSEYITDETDTGYYCYYLRKIVSIIFCKKNQSKQIHNKIKIIHDLRGYDFLLMKLSMQNIERK